MNKEIASFMETDTTIANTPQEVFANDVEGITITIAKHQDHYEDSSTFI